MPRDFEKSPRQRLEWFGFVSEFNLATSTSDLGIVEGSAILTHPVRLALSAGTVDAVAFPAGIVRGESCSIARMIGELTVYDVDRRQQNVSFALAAGLIRNKVEDSYIADPVALAAPVAAPDALLDRQASWLWHDTHLWNPQSAGANFTVAEWQTTFDTTNSRIFESNDVMQLSVNAQTRINSGAAVEVTLRCNLWWRCLLRLD